MTAEYIPRADIIGIDWRVIVFATATACLTSALSSLAPLWQAVRTGPSEVLSDSARASAGIRSRGLSRSLVVAEIALAFALLSVSGMLIAHLDRLNRASPGFDPRNLTTFAITLPDAIVSSDGKRVPFQNRLVEALTAIPGVAGAAFVNQLPLEGCCLGTAIYPEGYTPALDITRRTSLLPVSAEYFQTMRIPLRSGRLLTDRDARPGILLAVINEAIPLPPASFSGEIAE
jgi:hypothetical protein